MKKLKKWKKLLLIIVGIIVVVVVAGLLLFEIMLKPLVLQLSESRVRSLAAKAMNDAVVESLAGIDYADLVSVTTDNDNRITMLSANVSSMNILAAQTALNAQERISSLGDQGISIALGTIIGGSLFSGQGPKIKVSITPVGSVVSTFSSEFTDAGINQTLHRVKIRMEATVRIVLAGATGSSVSVTLEVPIAESIIVGNVPNSFISVPNPESALNFAIAD